MQNRVAEFLNMEGRRGQKTAFVKYKIYTYVIGKYSYFCSLNFILSYNKYFCSLKMSSELPKT